MDKFSHGLTMQLTWDMSYTLVALKKWIVDKEGGAYIGESTELLGLFKYAHPLQKLSAIQTYACALYGSNLWDLYGPTANQMYKCWNISVRDAWGVSRLTRTFIVDHLLSGSFTPIRQLVIRRYVRFVQGLISSTNPVVSTLANWAVNTDSQSLA